MPNRSRCAAIGRHAKNQKAAAIAAAFWFFELERAMRFELTT
ncbi:hypothetical protein RCCS2_15794 [Roseobacter sp. CCS2]|nr:hypothetical protein RCCS2_15794 [Roseobacter sp. CCS2]